MDDQLIAALLAVGIMIVVGFPVHEFCHAWAAYMLGDSTARWQGRLTLDPRVHFDPLGGLILAFSAVLSGGRFFIGWARPTPVNPYNLRYGRRGEAIVAGIGPVSNLVMALVVAVPLRLVWAEPGLQMAIQTSLTAALINNVAVMFVVINTILFFFNLLPIPPLDGWKVVGGLVSARLAYQMRQLEQYGFLILLGVFFVGWRFLAPPLFGLINVLIGDAGVVPMGGLL